MKDINHWKRLGFRFEVRFPGEYDLWVNPDTMQKLRRYCDGREWLSNLRSGEYELVDDRMNESCYPLDGHYVTTKEEIHYGNPGERRTLPAGSRAIAEAATNLPHNSAIHYWLLPLGDWPEETRKWAESVGCGAHADELNDEGRV